jgi:hemolysin III
MTLTKKSDYKLGEEIANSVTHGIGVLLSIAALVLMIVFSVKYDAGTTNLLSMIVFGISLIILYSASTIYHSIPGGKAKSILKILDHSAIYILIAGTYTPFSLITLKGKIGMTILTVVWSIAILGILLQIFMKKKNVILSTLLYVGMGWVVIFAFNPLVEALPKNGLELLVAGGLAYTFGAVFYVMKKVPYFHMIFHLFVLAGSILHFLCVFFYVLPVH